MGLSKVLTRAMSTSKTTRMRNSTYPKWTGPSQCLSPVVPNPPIALPLRPPPVNHCPNSLPPRPETNPPQGFSHSRHIIPAAFPRTYKQSTGKLERSSEPFTKTPRSDAESSEERKKRNLEEARQCVRARFGATSTTGEDISNQAGLWVAGERWIRADDEPGDGLTLVLSAANGFTKESWMPTIRRLLTTTTPAKNAFGTSDLPGILTSSRIDEIWFLDDYHHGQSIDLNKGLIGPVHSWLDGGRDVGNFIKHILPDERDIGETPPWRQNEGRARKVIGLGHSVGGNAMVRAAQLYPDLFHAIFLVEPMTPPIHATPEQLEHEQWHTRFWRPVITMRRRTTWKTMSEALSVRSSPFFQSWHDEVFKIWETHHLVPCDQGVTLATPSWAEAAVFSETTGLAEGWDALPSLKVPVGFLMAGDATSTLGEELTREMVWRPPVVANERVMDAGHLIVHEKPDAVADAIQRFLYTLQKDRTKSERAKL